MKSNNLYSFGIDDQNFCPSKTFSVRPIPLPLEMPKRKTGKQKIYVVLIVIFLLVELIGLILGLCFLFDVQQQLNQVSQITSDSPKVPQKLIGNKDKDKAKTKNDIKIVAHLTVAAKVSDVNSTTLLWEDRVGFAFTHAVAYKNGALVINETGYYFIYSRIYFRGRECEQLTLQQIVFRHGVEYPRPVALMEMSVTNENCVGSRMWGKNTYQAGIFHLDIGVRLYVTVSHSRMVAVQQTTNYFGIYKL